eukprot:m.17772 g.17772  ORF g.17772 m.17772 type:complete len:882 (+) comp6114_c0_seq1:365-3010(+)
MEDTTAESTAEGQKTPRSTSRNSTEFQVSPVLRLSVSIESSDEEDECIKQQERLPDTSDPFNVQKTLKAPLSRTRSSSDTAVIAKIASSAQIVASLPSTKSPQVRRKLEVATDSGCTRCGAEFTDNCSEQFCRFCGKSQCAACTANRVRGLRACLQCYLAAPKPEQWPAVNIPKEKRTRKLPPRKLLLEGLSQNRNLNGGNEASRPRSKSSFFLSRSSSLPFGPTSPKKKEHVEASYYDSPRSPLLQRAISAPVRFARSFSISKAGGAKEDENVPTMIAMDTGKDCHRIDSLGFTIPEKVLASHQRAVASRSIPCNDIDVSLEQPCVQGLDYTLMFLKRIQPQDRAALWYSSIGASRLEAEDKHDYAYYISVTDTLDVATVEQVQKDVPRTFADSHPRFSSDSPDSVLPMLDRLLQAVMVARPNHNYWQGLNYIAGFLLIVYQYSEDKSFWALRALLDNVLKDVFGPFGPRVELDLLETILRNKLPVMCKYMESKGVPVQTYTIPWMMCMFTTTTPAETTLQMWDLVLLGPSFHRPRSPDSREGLAPWHHVNILLLLIVALFTKMEHKILKYKDAIGINEGIKHEVRQFYDYMALVELSRNIAGGVESFCSPDSGWHRMLSPIRLRLSRRQSVGRLRSSHLDALRKKFAEGDNSQLNKIEFMEAFDSVYVSTSDVSRQHGNEGLGQIDRRLTDSGINDVYASVIFDVANAKKSGHITFLDFIRVSRDRPELFPILHASDNGNRKESESKGTFTITVTGARYVKSKSILETVLDLGHLMFTLTCNTNMITDTVVTRSHEDFVNLHQRLLKLEEAGCLEEPEASATRKLEFPTTPLTSFSLEAIAERRLKCTQFLDEAQAIESEVVHKCLLGFVCEEQSKLSE